MKLQILQENLIKALIRVGRIIQTKPQLPILQNILLETEEGRLKLTATNLETTEIVWIGAKIQEEGSLCVPSKLLSEYISSIPQGTVSLEEKEGALLIQCLGFKATIPGSPSIEFPPVAKNTEKNPMILNKETFIMSVEQVIFSAATDEGRPILTGIKITQKEGSVVFAATDGYRLSVKKQLMEGVSDLNLLVPAKAIGEVLKISGEEKGVTEIAFFKLKDNQLVFVIGDTEVRTRLIDGDYPVYEKIIPTKVNTTVIFEKEQLLRAVRSASIFARDSANIIKMHIDTSSVSVSANTPQVGEDQVDVEARIDGEGGDLAFNSRFLLDLLTNVSSDEVILEMTGSLNPGVFKLVGDNSYLHIIMPVRISG